MEGPWPIEFDMTHLKEMVIGFTAFTVSLLEGIYLGKFDHAPSITLFSLSPWESLVNFRGIITFYIFYGRTIQISEL